MQTVQPNFWFPKVHRPGGLPTGEFFADRRGHAANRTSSRSAGGDIAGARTLASRVKRDGKLSSGQATAVIMSWTGVSFDEALDALSVPPAAAGGAAAPTVLREEALAVSLLAHGKHPITVSFELRARGLAVSEERVAELAATDRAARRSPPPKPFLEQTLAEAERAASASAVKRAVGFTARVASEMAGGLNLRDAENRVMAAMRSERTGG